MSKAMVTKTKIRDIRERVERGMDKAFKVGVLLRPHEWGNLEQGPRNRQLRPAKKLKECYLCALSSLVLTEKVVTQADILHDGEELVFAEYLDVPVQFIRGFVGGFDGELFWSDSKDRAKGYKLGKSLRERLEGQIMENNRRKQPLTNNTK